MFENLICISSVVLGPISANHTSMESLKPGETSREGNLKNLTVVQKNSGRGRNFCLRKFLTGLAGLVYICIFVYIWSIENNILFCIFFSEAKCPKEYGFMCMAGKQKRCINSTLGSPESDIKDLIEIMIIQIEWMECCTFFHICILMPKDILGSPQPLQGPRVRLLCGIKNHKLILPRYRYLYLFYLGWF